MNIKIIGEWKSLKDFEWNNIPSLAIITGINGVGKTQLLQTLSLRFSLNSEQWKTQFPNFEVIVEGVHYNSKEVGGWGSKGGNMPNEYYSFHFLDIKNFVLLLLEIVKPERQELLQSLRNNLHDSTQELNKLFSRRPIAKGLFDSAIRNRINEIISYIESASGVSKENFTGDIIVENFPIEIIMKGMDIINQDCIEMLFYVYQYNKNNGLRNGRREEEFGPPPWFILNEIIMEAGLPYYIPPPNDKDFNFSPLMDMNTDPYSIFLQSTINNKILSFNDLSGGERIIMSLAFLNYYAKGRNTYKKLLLMDEPDAHLHPSMAKKFFDVIHNILIKKYGVRVIMTTHSPTTLAMAPDVEECQVFEMRKEPKTEIIRVDSITKVSSLLTGGLITVNPTTKFVLVEDEEDVEFYSRALEILKLTNQIGSFVSIVFISSGNNKEGKERVSGGKTVVKDWTEKLKKSGLSNIIFGLVDKDKGDVSNGLFVLSRYSIENYLVDPLIIFGALLESEIAPQIESVNIKYGKLHKIKNLDQDTAQKFANEIIVLIEKDINSFSPKDKEKEPVRFSNGLELTYPKWLLHKRGHDLVNIIGLKYEHKNINFKNLLNSMRKVELIPQDIKSLMLNIWNQ